jgi:glycolate oxidase iron-sulfur subunit
VGYQAAGTGKACCGALHAHSGFATEASQRAQSLLQAVPKNTPLVVNSAGCGSTIKSHGDDLANRTFDAAEFLFNHGITTQLSQAPGFPNLRVAYHPACHLHHGQNVITQPLDLLRAIPGVNLIPLNEAELCCGSAGTYNIFQPKMARQLLDRKWANIEHTQVDLVVTGNPGCHAWIAQAAREHASPVRVLHTLELLESAFSGLRI